MNDVDLKGLDHLLDAINDFYYGSARKFENRVVIDTDILIDHLR